MSSTLLGERNSSDLIARHPAIFAASRRKALLACASAAAVLAYLVFAWWFFAMGSVFANGRWELAGAYLADWVSYESRPNLAFENGYLDVSFPRFDPMGKNPDPDWLVTQSEMVERKVISSKNSAPEAGTLSSSNGFLGAMAASPVLPENATGTGKPDERQDVETIRSREVVHALVRIGKTNVVEIEPGRVSVTRNGETLITDIVREKSVTARGELPEWASQSQPGGKIVVSLGFSGRVEIEDDEVEIRHRFPGWANFLFDANSPFWGKSAGEVIAMIRSDERIDPERSNLALAWNNILYNAEWQHLDVWTKLLQTVVMAFVGTLFATLLAFPLAFAAARNITPNRIANQVLKRFFDFLRSVDMLIWALFFTRAFGPGPLAGISAIFFTDTGTFGKLYSEALENIDDRQREGIRSVGAVPSSVQRFGVVPQVLPVFLSQSLYFWESNTRSATIIGAVGAGGIGLKLWEAMRTNSDWENVAYMVILILAVVFIFDAISNALRSRLIGGAS